MTQPKIEHLEEPRPGKSITQATVDGVDCYAFNVQPGDVNEWDRGNIASGNTLPNERAELSYEVAPSTQKGKSPWNVTPASGKQVYRLRYRFRAGFPASRWNVFTQMHPPDNWGGPHGFGGITGHGANIDIVDPSDETGTRFIYSGPIKPDVWGYDWDLGVNWSPTADGYVVLVDRPTGKQLARWTGITLPQGMAYKYLKQGYYRNPTASEGTVYQTLMDIVAGDISDVAPTPAQPDAAASQLATTISQLRPALATATRALDDAQAFLDKLK